ncbi:DNA-binding response regulator [Paraglaciecola aquimarina]|uniref:DNA-binding response regulator n=1 Tax=Paraglaciecola aquimarina TaxID=1235557 RepID=A0ABU3SVT9_9ALTE|nr:DNA-binding response regulator [Paraglaciecola aquimarina]MDU0354135.1 DNA-binding response regulator [Paraglaciecola aquimarina]
MSSSLGKIVLVVDDSPESLGMLNAALNAQGYTALVALDGLQALSIIEKIQPDVILLDAMMPQMDGFEACHKLKQQLPNTPIIFMTGLSDSEDVVRGFEAGAIDYVTKPISPDEVIARINTHIETAKVALSAQDALDHTGTHVFCVNNQGRLSWATPNVHKLIDTISERDNSPWATLASKLEVWLNAGTSVNLKLSCFAKPIEIHYDGRQDDKHLLNIIEAKQQKNADFLRQNLPITKRESEVLYWVSYGKTSWEISQILDMSPRTANKHLEQIFKKLGVDNRTSAAAISIRLLEH